MTGSSIKGQTTFVNYTLPIVDHARFYYLTVVCIHVLAVDIRR